MSDASPLLDRARVEFDRALQRNLNGIGYFISSAPALGASAKDLLLRRGTMTLYHYCPVDLARIAVPFLHVTAEHDHIVPSAASAPLIDMVGSAVKEQVTLKGGHVSLVAGGNAIKRLWPKLVEWLGDKSV